MCCSVSVDILLINHINSPSLNDNMNSRDIFENSLVQKEIVLFRNTKVLFLAVENPGSRCKDIITSFDTYVERLKKLQSRRITLMLLFCIGMNIGGGATRPG